MLLVVFLSWGGVRTYLAVRFWQPLVPTDQACRRARASQGQALKGGREDAASLDRPCARRLRDLAVGTEECSRRGSNQRMDAAFRRADVCRTGRVAKDRCR